MTVKSLSHSSLEDNRFYRSMLVGNVPFEPYNPAFELLETQVLTSTVASVSFTGLGSYTDYKHLQIRWVARNNSLSDTGWDYLNVQLNSDTGSNYATHYLRGDGSSVSSSAFISSGQMIAGKIGPRPAPVRPSAGVIDFLDFSNSLKNTTMRSLAGTRQNFTNVDEVGLYSGHWRNTAAVTSITLQVNASIYTGSRFSLYGVKG